MITKTNRGGLGVVLGACSVLTVGCSSAPADSSEVTGADDSVASTADALTGNVGVGTTLRTTTGLNLRSGPGTGYAILVTMPAGAIVSVRQSAPVNSFYAISYGGRSGFAYGSYLAVTGGGTSGGAQVNIAGPAVRPNVQAFANAECATLGCPYTIGTYVGHQPTADRAIDNMQAPIGTLPRDGGAHGTSVANFALQHFGAYRVLYVIWRQRINSSDGRGWRTMADRGSLTQNHFDHVHVSFNL